MKFCSSCAGTITLRVPADDTRERFVCLQCEAIHYTNPKVVTGCLPVWEDKVLLCKRAIEPRRGYWTLPAGFLENGETMEAGAARETWEEAEARVANTRLYTVFSLPHISQVYTFYRAELVNGEFGVGSESLATDLFAEADIPWDELAFPVVTDTLKHYFADRRSNVFPVHDGEIQFARRLGANKP